MAIMAAARISFLLVGIVSTAVMIASTVLPYSADLLSTSLPRIRILALAWLSPFYLFITVHFIIIAIWRLQGSNPVHRPPDQKEEVEEINEETEIDIQMKPPSETPLVIPTVTSAETPDSVPPDFAPDPADPSRMAPEEDHDNMDATWKAIVKGDGGAASMTARPLMRKSDTWERRRGDRESSPGTPETSYSVPPDSPPDPADPSKTDFEEEHDNMDATWKAILKGDAGAASMVAPPQVRKSDTWERRRGDLECSPGTAREARFRKSETFRRISVGREELFGRAEAFIRTNYEQRRNQRQESEQRYIEMVNAAC